MIHDDSGIIWNLLLQSFTIFYIQIDTDFYTQIQHDLALQNGFVVFFAENNEQTYKMVYSFFLKNANPQFTNRFGFTKCYFLGGNFHRWVVVPNNFTKLFCFFSEKMKNLCFLLNTTQWFYMFLGFGQRLGLALQNGFSTFQKTTDTSTKWFVFFFWENVNSLIQK